MVGRFILINRSRSGKSCSLERISENTTYGDSLLHLVTPALTLELDQDFANLRSCLPDVG